MIRRRRRPNVTKEPTAPLDHEAALDAVEKLRAMTPTLRVKAWEALRPRIVEHLRTVVGPASASYDRKRRLAEVIVGLYLKHAEGKASFLPLRAPRTSIAPEEKK